MWIIGKEWWEIYLFEEIIFNFRFWYKYLLGKIRWVDCSFIGYYDNIMKSVSISVFLFNCLYGI